MTSVSRRGRSPVSSAVSSETVTERFRRLAASGRMGHAYLFSGPVETGKTATALAVARLLNCDSTQARPCGLCPACRKILSGNHPDVRVLRRGEEQTIRIDAVRDLIGRLHLRPFEARFQVCVIEDADRLTPEGANALLKSLEEPGAGAVLILTTAVPERCPATIRSRCQPVLFFPGGRRRAAATLKEEGLAPGEALFLGAYTEGGVARARRLSEEGFPARKNEIIDKMIFSRDNDAYIKTITGDKERTREVLEVLLTWFRDLFLWRRGAGEEALIHADRTGDVRRCASMYSPRHLDAVLREIVEALRMGRENLNMKIPLMVLRERICVAS